MLFRSKSSKKVVHKLLPYLVACGASYAKVASDVIEQSTKCATLCGNGQFGRQTCDMHCNLDPMQTVIAAGVVATVTGYVIKVGLDKVLPLFNEQSAD